MTARPTAATRTAVTLCPVPVDGEVWAGDDLAARLLVALAEAGLTLADGDVLVVSSKVVSKAEGRTAPAARREEVIAEESLDVVAERDTGSGVTRIVRSRSGPVLAAAGVDASNVLDGTVLRLPADPDGSARSLRRALAERTGRQVGVLVTDTAGRPWREGQTDFALGASGMQVLEDLRGGTDHRGRPLSVTVRALADQLAGAAELVKGKQDGVPAALVRGLGHLVTEEDGPGAAALIRAPDQDWFRYGHVEAVRSALGAPPGAPSGAGVPPAPVAAGLDADPDAARLTRALAVAAAGEPGPTPRVQWNGPHEVLLGPAATAADLVRLGAYAQRTATAAAAEGLSIRFTTEPTESTGSTGETRETAATVRIITAG